jgi:uncharacterized protein
MKTLLLILLSISVSVAQDQNEVIDREQHKIVMQFSDGDSLAQVIVTGQVKNIKTAWPNAIIEVVCHGQGLDLLMTKNTKAAKEVSAWSAQGVTFAACNNSMRRRNIKKEDLLSVSQVVPSAMVELVRKQEAGWSYVKGGH